MRLAFYACLLLVGLCFWATIAFMVVYFVTFNQGFGNATIVSFAGCLVFLVFGVAIAKYEAAQ
jgi:hypothetical protein